MFAALLGQWFPCAITRSTHTWTAGQPCSICSISSVQHKFIDVCSGCTSSEISQRNQFVCDVLSTHLSTIHVPSYLCVSFTCVIIMMWILAR